MKERDLTNIFIKTVNTDGFEAVNIPDSISMVEKPYDIIVNYRGKFVPIEFKRHTDYSAFNPNELRDSQIRGLNKSEESNGYPLVGLFIWKPNTYNRLIIWDWKTFKEDTNNLTRSITKKELEYLPFVECHKKRFELQNFYNFLDVYTTL